MKKIRTWRERCQDLDANRITTTGDIQRVMQEEIDELRASLYVGGIPAGCKLICEKCGADNDSPCGWPAHCESRISGERS